MTVLCKRRLTALLCGFAFSIATSSGFAATNLLTNPGFATDLSGWQNLFARTATWDALDANGSGGSGSAVVLNELNPSNAAVPTVLSQCASATSSTLYSFGARLKVPAGQPEGTAPQLIAQSFASGDCSGDVVQQVFEFGTTSQEWTHKTKSFTTNADVQSIRLLLGVFKPLGVTATASGYFDDVFLQQGDGSPGFVIGPAMSASWFNLAQSGHGIMVHLMSSTQAWMCWFTFDLSGDRAWICALGSIAGDTLTFAEAFTVEGGKFPPLFDPATIVEAPWGSITVTFTGCDAGTMQWTTSAAGFQSGSMPLARLTPLWGIACP